MANPYLNKIFKNTAIRFNTTPEECEIIFNSQFKFIKEKVESYNLYECTEEEFINTKKNFNVPRLFKLYASWKQKERIENNQFKKKENGFKKNK